MKIVEKAKGNDIIDRHQKKRQSKLLDCLFYECCSGLFCAGVNAGINDMVAQ